MEEIGLLSGQCKESAKRYLANVEDLMSNVPLGKFARTFKDGDKSFYSATGFQCTWQFFCDLRTCSWLLEKLHPCAGRKTA